MSIPVAVNRSGDFLFTISCRLYRELRRTEF